MSEITPGNLEHSCATCGCPVRPVVWVRCGSRRTYPRSRRPAYQPAASRHNVSKSSTEPRWCPDSLSQMATQSSEQKIRWLLQV